MAIRGITVANVRFLYSALLFSVLSTGHVDDPGLKQPKTDGPARAKPVISAMGPPASVSPIIFSAHTRLLTWCSLSQSTVPAEDPNKAFIDVMVAFATQPVPAYTDIVTQANELLKAAEDKAATDSEPNLEGIIRLDANLRAQMVTLGTTIASEMHRLRSASEAHHRARTILEKHGLDPDDLGVTPTYVIFVILPLASH